MGNEVVEESVEQLIFQNIDYLNQEFEGLIRFEVNSIIPGGDQGYLPELRDDLLSSNYKRVERLLQPVEKKGRINIFLFDTYVRSQQRGAMLGFTPILSNEYVGYAPSSPSFDRLYLAYSSLEDKSTIVHEMGHFFNLKHPWEQDETERKSFGITAHNLRSNHMNYDPSVNHFTDEQLEYMYEFALQFRSYLIQRTEFASLSRNHGV